MKKLKRIEFYKHNLSEHDKQEMLNVLDSLFLTTGSTVATFEKKFADYMGSTFAVGVMSCTHALELSLRAFGIGYGDEVITTPLSFVATANAIESVGAKPVFVDVEADTGNIDARLIERAITKKTKAVLPVHLYGQMCDMKKIRAIADAHNLKVIEDCAHCVEGSRDGIRPGQLSDAACFSFYATKNLACGEGGAITCNDEKLYDWFLQARQHGMSKSAIDRYQKKYQHYDVAFVGMKCNMSNVQAALLINQLDSLDSFLKKRMNIAQKYNFAFEKKSFIRIPIKIDEVKHAWHLYTILVDSLKRDRYLHTLQEKGIGVAVNFRPIHLLTYYRKKYGYEEGDFSQAEYIGASTITLPFYPKLTDEEILYVIETVHKVVKG